VDTDHCKFCLRQHGRGWFWVTVKCLSSDIFAVSLTQSTGCLFVALALSSGPVLRQPWLMARLYIARVG
jgi:hypothetical protein